MNSTPAFHHSLLRPCVLHVLRAAGYHSTRPSVLDAFTDIAARYMVLIAQAASDHSVMNHTELELSIEDVRMAMQDCGAIAPGKILEEQIYDGEEDTRGVDAFIEWAMGPENKEIRRIALDGSDEGKEDYLTALKKKHNKTGEETRYQGTLLGKPAETRAIAVEGADVTSIKDWADNLKSRSLTRKRSASLSRQPSSDLSSIGDQDMEGIEF